MKGGSRIPELAHRALSDPVADDALRALTALRAECAQLEKVRVAQALRDGLTWSRIAAALGISKQAAHRKHRGALEEVGDGFPRANGADPRKVLVTAEARRCVGLARERAREQGTDLLATEHLLLGILSSRRSHALDALHSLSIDLAGATEHLRGTLEGESGDQEEDGVRGLTAHARRILEGATRAALGLGDGYIGVEHLLLALLNDRDNGAVRTLEAMGASVADVREALAASWRELEARTARL